jgi:hypothetical protein
MRRQIKTARSRPLALRWQAGALALLLATSTSCASPRMPSLPLHLALHERRIAVVPAAAPVGGSVELFASGRLEGALEGAGAGSLAGLGTLSGSHCSGEICGAALLLSLAVAVVAGTTLGAVTGALRATPQQEAERIEHTVNRCVQELPAHLDLSRRVVETAQREGDVTLALLPATVAFATAADRAALRAQGFDYVLEIGVRRIEFGGGVGTDPELALALDASARLVETSTGEVAYEREFRRVGVPRRYSAWAAAGAEPMRHALAEALRELADDVANALFAQVDLGIASGTWALPGTHRYGTCWLTPEHPPNEYPFMGRELRWVEVAPVRLTLRWEPFPDERQRAKLERQSERTLGAVRYDLRIWAVRREERGELVYERRDLAAPMHRLEQPLASARRYFWSVRACFALGEATACTPWASSLVPSRGGRTCESPGIPAWNYFRFVTR